MSDKEEKTTKILFAEDDEKITSFVDVYLDKEGYQVQYAVDGEEALEKFHKFTPDLIILDVMMPKMSGIEVCKAVRKYSNVPVLMLTALTHEEDKIIGFAAGADDYLTKPFSPRELMARIKSLLRRVQPQKPPSPTFSFRDLHINFEKCEVKLKGQAIYLTAFEYKLLQTLVENPGKVFSREELLSRLYPDEEFDVTSRTVDVHIGKLREKIEEDTTNPKYILTVRGLGYKFAE